MTTRPSSISVYHITHVDNLPSIVANDGLLSDAEMEQRGSPHHAVGMSSIKQRRMGLPVKCHPGDFVGEFVPFYFCPRSIMLYLLYMANHPELTYRGGQEPIVHLEFDLGQCVDWAETSGAAWAFSLANAGAVYAPFRDDLKQLDEVDWCAVAANDFRSPEIKEGKQAEFLVKRFVPLELVARIGVMSEDIADRAREAFGVDTGSPRIDVLPRWYF
jgi:ssDNA thymidine ADP-ribosyltransferase DarT-like protein